MILPKNIRELGSIPESERTVRGGWERECDRRGISMTEHPDRAEILLRDRSGRSAELAYRTYVDTPSPAAWLDEHFPLEDSVRR